MKPFSLRSEEFSPEGSVSGLAIRRNMGRSSMDAASLLLREAVQNAWDARVDKENGRIGFQIHLSSLTTKQADVLNGMVFRSRPPNHPIDGAIAKGTGMMVLRDCGTLGLNGPLFHVARRGPQDDRSRNFIRFVRDIGRGASKQRGGGTYGFGKSTFFTGSAIGTIIVYTRCVEDGGEPEDRLIAMSLWSPSEDEVLTGRHWWGTWTKDGISPLRGEAAAELAQMIGLPRFKRKETGTCIAMIAPLLVEPYRTPDHEAARVLAETLTTWFWPRMTESPGGGPWIDFGVFVEGRPVPVPQPSELEPFRSMASMLTGLAGQGGQTDAVEKASIVCEKPKATLGMLAAAPLTMPHQPAAWKALAIEGHVLAELLDSPGSGSNRAHHIALMRSPWQVVRYLSCRPIRASGHGFAGVFLVDVDPTMDEAFAESEPPAHDDWIPDGLEDGYRRRYVRIALRRIRENGDRISEQIDGQASAGRGPDLSRLSSLLGGLVPGSGSDRKRPAPVSASAKQADHGALAVNLVDQGTMTTVDGMRAFAITFRLLTAPEKAGVEVTANPRILIVGGGTEHDDDGTRPSVIGWRDGPDGSIRRSQVLRLGSNDPLQWQVLVSVPVEAQIGISITSRKASA